MKRETIYRVCADFALADGGAALRAIAEAMTSPRSIFGKRKRGYAGGR